MNYPNKDHYEGGFIRGMVSFSFSFFFDQGSCNSFFFFSYREMVKENALLEIQAFMKENGKMILCKEKVFILLQTKINMMDNLF